MGRKCRRELVNRLDIGGASVLRADGNIALFNVAGGVSQLFVGVAGEPKSTVFTASDGFDFYLNKDTIHAIDDIEGNEVVLGFGFSSIDKLNGATFDVKGDSNAMAVLGNDKLDRITAVIGVGNSVTGATVAAAAGASFILTDSTGTVTFGAGSAADTFTLASANDSSVGVGFNVNDKVAVGSISYVSKNDIVFGDFTNGRIVNGDSIKATDNIDSVIGVAGNNSYSGVSELFVQANATVTAWGNASSVNALGAGDYVFIGADNATQTFTAADTTDSLLTFITDKNHVMRVKYYGRTHFRLSTANNATQLR